jgi:hypothetical protein
LFWEPCLSQVAMLVGGPMLMLKLWTGLGLERIETRVVADRTTHRANVSNSSAYCVHRSRS